MSITIHQIQNLMNAYHRQQIQSRFTRERSSQYESAEAEPQEDKVLISAEAKRIQIYQKTAEGVLKRLMLSARDEDAEARGDSAPEWDKEAGSAELVKSDGA